MNKLYKYIVYVYVCMCVCKQSYGFNRFVFFILSRTYLYSKKNKYIMYINHILILVKSTHKIVILTCTIVTIICI